MSKTSTELLVDDINLEVQNLGGIPDLELSWSANLINGNTQITFDGPNAVLNPAPTKGRGPSTLAVYREDLNALQLFTKGTHDRTISGVLDHSDPAFRRRTLAACFADLLVRAYKNAPKTLTLHASDNLVLHWLYAMNALKTYVTVLPVIGDPDSAKLYARTFTAKYLKVPRDVQVLRPDGTPYRKFPLYYEELPHSLYSVGNTSPDPSMLSLTAIKAETPKQMPLDMEISQVSESMLAHTAKMPHSIRQELFRMWRKDPTVVTWALCQTKHPGFTSNAYRKMIDAFHTM